MAEKWNARKEERNIIGCDLENGSIPVSRWRITRRGRALFVKKLHLKAMGGGETRQIVFGNKRKGWIVLKLRLRTSPDAPFEQLLIGSGHRVHRSKSVVTHSMNSICRMCNNRNGDCPSLPHLARPSCAPWFVDIAVWSFCLVLACRTGTNEWINNYGRGRDGKFMPNVHGEKRAANKLGAQFGGRKCSGNHIY